MGYARQLPKISKLSLVVAIIAGCGGGGGGSNNTPADQRIEGSSQTVNGFRVSTFAVVNPSGDVTQVGVTMPAGLATSPPTAHGDGPAHAVASIAFPAVVRNTTMFNHFEMHYEEAGHPPAVYQRPHFDLHFYRIPEATVRGITPPDSVAPATNRVPEGYTYPGVNAAVPQMGVHAAPNSDFAPGFEFEKTMIYGYWGGELIFVEPMITTDYLKTKQSYSLTLPQPAQLGFTTRFPRRFDAHYDLGTDSWTLIYSDFRTKS